MTHSNEPIDARAPADAEPGAVQARRLAAIDRRRLLLKGVGKGGALLGATVPLKTFAGQRIITFDQTQCTVSGNQSVIHSAAPGNPICRGYPTSSWGKSDDNGTSPSIQKPWPTGVNYQASCKSVFSRCTLQVTNPLTNLKSDASLFQVVNRYPNSDDAHWVCAWLNSQSPASMNFPYGTADVMSFYNGQNSVNALAFFKKYTEQPA